MQNRYLCMKLRLTLALLLALISTLEAKTVFVTVPPQLGIIKQIAGDLVNVVSLTQGQSCPETFSPTPKQMEALLKADLFMDLGMPFEKIWLKKVAKNNKVKIVSMSQGIKLREMEPGHHHKHEHHNNNDHQKNHHGEKDPHIWTSVENVIIMAENTHTALKELIPTETKKLDDNLKSFKEKAYELDKKLKKELKDSKGKAVFVFHPYYGYFTDSYDLIQFPIEAEGKSPTAKQLAHIIKEIEKQNKKIILIQPEFDTKVARSLADQTGAKLITVSIYSQDVLKNIEALAKIWK